MKLDAAVAAREQFHQFLSQRVSRGKVDDIEYIIIKKIYDNLDLNRYEEIRRSLLGGGTIGSEAKYLDLLYWLRSKLRIAVEHDMHRLPPQRLLDLGTGAGHFPFLCQLFGHKVTGLDLGHIELYNRLVEFFEIRRVDFEIKPFKALPPFPQPFDMVTGFMVGFNKRSRDELWGEEEWTFFLRDLARNVLARDGRVLLKLIRNTSMPGLHYWDPAFARFIRERGGSVDPDNGYVTFHRLDGFREPS